MATMGVGDRAAALEDIHSLPLEQRYVWRIVSALEWAFADFDSVAATEDIDTLYPSDLATIEDAVTRRLHQILILLRAMVGTATMKNYVFGSIKLAEFDDRAEDSSP